MKKYFLLACFIGLLNTGAVVACDIENKREIEVGTSEGIAGTCPDNTGQIQCINDGEGADRFTCNGPSGSYSGPNLQALIATACGCSAAQNNEAMQTLQ